MEKSQIIGGAEECHSSESGWTMYIGSLIDGDGHSDDGDNDNMDDEVTQADAEYESDDSMASDASSGPSHHCGNQWGNTEGGYGLGDFHQAEEEEEEDDEKFCLDKKEKKTKDKQIAEKKVEKNELVFIDNKGKAPS